MAVRHEESYVRKLIGGGTRRMSRETHIRKIADPRSHPVDLKKNLKNRRETGAEPELGGGTHIGMVLHIVAPMHTVEVAIIWGRWG